MKAKKIEGFPDSCSIADKLGKYVGRYFGLPALQTLKQHNRHHSNIQPHILTNWPVKVDQRTMKLNKAYLIEDLGS